jgi:hypothetical protein
MIGEINMDIGQAHYAMQLKIRDGLIARYNALHAVCPECTGKDYSSTYMGFIYFEEEEETRDPNECKCPCGWAGIGHDLIPEPQH